jgi:hypothetical protein
MHPVASLFRATKGTPEARLSTDHVAGCRGVVGLQAVTIPHPLQNHQITGFSYFR